MKILKFGGTSVGSVENLRKIKDILIADKSQIIVICSAMSGVTDHLICLVNSIKNRDSGAITKSLISLENKHTKVIDELISDQYFRDNIKDQISSMIMDMFELSRKKYSEIMKSEITTYGESLLTCIFSEYLNWVGVNNLLLDAKEFMHIDTVENPNIKKVSKKLNDVLRNRIQSRLYITQGFVCRNQEGQISDLKRGGSDYTATIIGAALNVEEVQIWTDIDGLHNNDPRYVMDTYPISHVNYCEASSLAYFGAKILHQQTVFPIREKMIPIRIKNTFKPDAFGTIISNKNGRKGLKAISAKDNITLLKIESNKTLVNYEYFKKVFEIFCRHKVAIDMVATSEVSISLAIDDLNNLDEIIYELKKYSEVSVCYNCSIVCIVGESVIDDSSSYRIFEILKHTNLKMISSGSNDNNISVLINTKDKISVLNYLNQKLFQIEYQPI